MKIVKVVIILASALLIFKSNSVLGQAASKKQIDSINNLQYDVKVANTATSIQWFTKNLQNAQKIKYRKGIADSYANLGLVFYINGKYAKNTTCMLHAIRWYENLGLKSQLAHAYANTTLGNGLNNLKKRAKEINGKISVTSQEQIGTTVSLHFKTI